MTGSVPSDTHTAVSAEEKEKKAEGLQKAATKNAHQYPSPTRTSEHRRKDSKSLLPSLLISGVPFIAGAATGDQSATVPRRRRHRPLRRTNSAPPKAAKMEENRSLGSRPERSLSLFALHLPSSSSSSSVRSGDTLSSLVGDYGGSAKSEIGAPAVVRVEPGHMKRAVSYTSLSMRSGTPFRSANSTRPLPAPPRTTTDLEFHRYPVASTPRIPRCGTPRTNHAHHAGLHFQNSYNRGGKAYETWSQDMYINSKLPLKSRHFEITNFTGGKARPYTPVRGGTPDFHYSSVSLYHSSSRQPQSAGNCNMRIPTTRFGSGANRGPAFGMAPNMAYGAERRRVRRLYVPRGCKVESLV